MIHYRHSDWEDSPNNAKQLLMEVSSPRLACWIYKYRWVLQRVVWSGVGVSGGPWGESYHPESHQRLLLSSAIYWWEESSKFTFKLSGLRRELIFALAYRPVCSSRGMLICLRTVRLAGGKTHFTLRGERTPECGHTQTQHAGVRLIYIKGRRQEQTSASTPWTQTNQCLSECTMKLLVLDNRIIHRERRACLKTKHFQDLSRHAVWTETSATNTADLMITCMRKKDYRRLFKTYNFI